MATIAVPLRRVDIARMGTALPLIVGLAGTLLSWFGSGWDVSWHRIFGRDTFWSTPHLFIYTGVALWGVAALIATGTAMAGRPIRGRALVLGPLRAELGLALIGVGALVTIAAGPFDNLWHSLFGRDVDIWSPPHLAGILGGAIGLLGWLAATAPGVFPIDDGLRRLLRLFTLGNMCAVSIFALNFYYVTSVAREGFFYPLLVTALLPATLAIATVAIPGRWGATWAAFAYTVIGLIGYGILAASGWRPPAFPALVIAGAVAIDLLRARGGRWAHPLALGLAFVLAFVAAEFVRTVLFAPPVPTSALGGAEPRLTSLFFYYYEQTVARPWLSPWPLAAAIVGTPVAAASWLVGRWIARPLALGDDLHTEALAHS
jgi:hypothetical protein